MSRPLRFEQVEARQLLAASPVLSFTTQQLAPFDDTPLAVTGVTPGNGSTNISVAAIPSVQFNNAMNSSTVNSSTVTLTDGQGDAVAAAIGYDAGTNSATITPDSPLSRSTNYTITVVGGDSGVADANGNTLSDNFTASFTTEDALAVTGVVPDNGSTGAPIGSSVVVQFNNAMDASTINTSTVTLVDGQSNLVPATVSYDPGTQTATLTPTSPLTNSTTYTLTVSGGAGGVADADGGTLSADFESTFSTEAALAVTNVTPNDQTTDVPVDSSVTVQFNNAMDSSTIDSSTLTLMDGQGNTVPATVTYDSNSQTATLTPTSPLANLTTYTLTVSGGSGGVADQDGQTLANDFTSTFTTVAAPLAVTGVTPIDGSSNVSINSGVTVAFNNSMDSSTINSSTMTLTDGQGNVVPANVFYHPNAQTATISPSSPLDRSTTYTVTVTGGTDGVADTDGGVLSENFTSSFTTEDALAVTSVAPTNGSGNVSINPSVSVVFNNAMDSTTINSTTVTLMDGQGDVVPANVTYDSGTQTATLTPTAPLDRSTTYTLTIASGAEGVADADGGTLTDDFTSTFTTEDALAVNSITPNDGSSNVPTNTSVTVAFNNPMDASTINSTNITLMDSQNNVVAANVSYDSATQTATLTPTAPLSGLTTYTVTVVSGDNGVADADGGTLSSDATASFTTETALAVTGVTPTDGSSSVPTNTSVSVVFNNPMDSSTINSTTVTLKDGQGNVVAASVSYDSGTQTATLTPTAPLSGATTYTLTVTSGASGVTDENGGTLDADFTSSFTTENALTVTSVTPSDSATDLPTGTSVVIGFSNPMDSSTVNSTTVTLKDGQGNVIAANVGYDSGSQTATITPTSPLANSTTYTVTVMGGAGGVADDNGGTLDTDFTSSFTTEAALAVTSVTPSDGSTNTSIGTSVSVVFNNPMDSSTITSSTLTLKDSQGNVVAATVSYDAGTQTATITPTSPLSRSTTYTVTVTGGDSGVADENGSTLAEDFTSTFSTESALAVTSVTPSDGSSDVATSTTVSVVFNNAMNASTITSSTLTLTDGQGNAVAVTVSYDAASQTATITPSAALSASTTYTVTVTGGASGVADADGGTLAENFTSTFTTAAATPAAPTNLSVDPSSNTGPFDGNGYTTNDTPTIDVTAPTGSTVQIKLNGTVVATATETSAGSGQFIATLPAGVLGVGANSITAVATNANGTSPDSTALTVTYAANYSLGVYVVPGAVGSSQQVTFAWTSRSAWYNDEVGYFIADAATGAVNGILPGSPGYAQAGIGSSTSGVLFHSGQQAGVSQTLTLTGGQMLVFYMIQNNTTGNFLSKNPGDTNGANNKSNHPLAFFSVTAANPDGKQHTQIIADPTTGLVQYNWEDMENGDNDFNDVVMTVSSVASPTTVAALHAPGAGSTSVSLTGQMVSARNAPTGDIGVYYTDDASGTIGTLHPGDSGYAAAALAEGNFSVLFSAGAATGASQTVSVPAGKYLGFYLITSGTTADFLSSNSSNSISGSSVALFSFDSANPDGVNHFRWFTPGTTATDPADTQLHVMEELGGDASQFDDYSINLNFSQ